MSRAPLRATAIREPADDMPVKTKKTRLRKQASQRSLLDIEADIVNMIKTQFQSDLQWVTDSILGQPAPQKRMAFEINGWEPVTPDMFGGVFDGMFTRKGHQGEINFEGLVLMYRPMELTEEAMAEDAAARIGAMEAQRSMVMNGVIPGLNTSAGFEPMHPTAAGKHQFNRSVRAPMDIPTD